MSAKPLLLALSAVLLFTPLTVVAQNVSCSRLFTTAAPKRPGVAKLLKQIDQLAATLRSEGKLTSPIEWRKRSAEMGLPGLDLPRELGGSELPAAQMVEVFEHAGRYALDLRDVVGGAHVRPLVGSAEPSHKKIVEQVARGKGYIAIAITEPEAGSNMRAMKSTAEKTEGGYFITGEKLYNARFTTASHVVLFTKSSAGDSKLNAFVLPIDHPGLKYVELQAHGLKGNSFGGVSFDRVFVPDSARIGGEGEGGRVFRNHFLYWRLMMAAAAIGTGKAALDQAAERMKTREAFGAPIGRFTHLQQPLAEHTAKLHMAALLVKEAAKKIDRGRYDEAATLAAMAKSEGVEWALAASDFAMQVFGAEGYSHNVDLAQRVHDLQGLRIADGTTHVLRQEVVRKVYGEELWDMAIGNGN